MVGKKGRKKSSESIRATPKRRSTTAKRYFNSGSSNSDSDDEEEFQPPKKSSRKSRLQENSVAKTRKTQDKPLTSEEIKGSLAEPFPFGSSQPLLSESESSDDDNGNANLERKHFSNAVQSKQRACGLAGAKNQRSKPEVNLKGKSKDTGKEHEFKKRSSDYQEGKSVTNTEDCKQLVNNSVVKVIKESKPVKCDASIKTESRQKAEQQTRKSLRKTKNSDIVCKKMEEDDKNMTKKKRKLKVNENENNLKPDGKRFAQKKMKDVANVPLKVQKYLDSLAGSSNLVDVGMSSEGIESDSEDDWQDVHEADIDKSLLESPKKNENKEMTVKDVAVSLKVKSLYQSKSRKNREKFLQCVERTMRKFQNEVKTNLHKSHLVCLVARQILLNRTCNDLTLKALWLSLIPASMLKLPTSKWELAELRKFLNWFQLQDIDNLHISLQKINRKPKRIPQIQLFIAALRAIGLQARLVMSLQPITWKVDNANLFRLGNGKEQSLETKPPVAKLKNSQSKDGSKHQGKVTKSELEEEGMKRNDSTSKSPYFMTDTSDSDIKKELQAAEGIGKKKSTPKRRVTKAEATVIENVKKSAKSRKTNSKEVRLDKRNQNGKRMRARKKIDYKETDNEADDKGDCNDTDTVKESCEEAQNERKSDDDDDDDDDDFIEATKSSRKSIASKLSERREKRSCMPSVDRGYARKLVKTIDDDDEFDKTSKPVKFRKSLNNKANSPTVKVISSDSESCQSKESLNFVKNSISACDTWCEVYLKSVKKWTCVELANKSINEPSTCERNATQPLIYVLGIDNENAIKDVTCRYSAKFMSKTRKLRIDREWWAQTLHPYETKERKRDNLEDTELKMNLMQQPFPTTIGEFKNHPLYVLEGDLLKFEAIYPESPAVLGYFRNKAIYSRDCVHILHTRENWLKEARVVKQGEKAYKIVRGRPKRNTPIHERDKVKIDLFGLWQTEVYKPPPVKDGKVPRNEYGNVELFQPSMLPPGGVHVPIQGIHKTARKLGIDAAPAMMGWDFHGGCAHPIIEGVVVAAEFEEKLLDAWQKDEDERERKLKEKKEKKIIERWKLLVKGLNVRERIRKKYNFMESEDVERLKTRKDSKSATDVLVSWPLNKQEGTSSLNETGHCHVFPDSSHKQNKITGEWTKSCSCGLSLPFEKL